MAISNEMWEAIEKKLQGLFAEVVFEYKGHEITVQKGPLRENVRCLAVYIDGFIKCKDCVDLDKSGFDPLVVLFWRRRERQLFSKKYRAALVRYSKAIGEKRSKKEGIDPERKVVSYHPYFTTSKSLVRKFKRVEGLTLKLADNVDGGD